MIKKIHFYVFLSNSKRYCFVEKRDNLYIIYHLRLIINWNYSFRWHGKYLSYKYVRLDRSLSYFSLILFGLSIFSHHVLLTHLDMYYVYRMHFKVTVSHEFSMMHAISKNLRRNCVVSFESRWTTKLIDYTFAVMKYYKILGFNLVCKYIVLSFKKSIFFMKYKYMYLDTIFNLTYFPHRHFLIKILFWNSFKIQFKQNISVNYLTISNDLFLRYIYSKITISCIYVH